MTVPSPFVPRSHAVKNRTGHQFIPGMGFLNCGGPPELPPEEQEAFMQVPIEAAGPAAEAVRRNLADVGRRQLSSLLKRTS